jgi:hypothetical protein
VAKPLSQNPTSEVQSLLQPSKFQQFELDPPKLLTLTAITKTEKSVPYLEINKSSNGPNKHSPIKGVIVFGCANTCKHTG